MYNCIKDKVIFVSVTIHIFYSGKNGSAIKFMNEMISSGIVDKIRGEEGNLRYDYFMPINDKETILLIDSWENQEALDIHHKLPLMKKIMDLREKYDLHMKVEKFESIMDNLDKEFIRK